MIFVALEPATAQNAVLPESRIIGWDDAKSHKADWGEMRRYFGGGTFATKDALVAVARVLPGKSVHESGARAVQHGGASPLLESWLDACPIELADEVRAAILRLAAGG